MNIWNIIFGILWLVLGFLVYYLKTRTNIMEVAAEKISEAEKEYSEFSKAGSEKKKFVVSCIYQMLPAPMRLFFNEEVIGIIVQQVFDAAQKYATTQLDKIFNKDKDKIEAK